MVRDARLRRAPTMTRRLWRVRALRTRLFGALGLRGGAARADHHELAGPGAGDRPAALDLGRVGVERAGIVDNVIARHGRVIGLAEGDRAALPAPRECGVERTHAAVGARLMGRAREPAAVLDQRRDERDGAAVRIAVEAV